MPDVRDRMHISAGMQITSKAGASFAFGLEEERRCCFLDAIRASIADARTVVFEKFLIYCPSRVVAPGGRFEGLRVRYSLSRGDAEFVAFRQEVSPQTHLQQVLRESVPIQ